MGLDFAVFKGVSTMEREFPGHHFQREPTTGECELIEPKGVDLIWDDVIACDWRVGNIAHIGALLDLIAGVIGEGSALKRIVLDSHSGVGDLIEEPSFAELEPELKLIESSTDAWVREFADGLSELIGMARREKNPIVFV